MTCAKKISALVNNYYKVFKGNNFVHSFKKYLIAEGRWIDIFFLSMYACFVKGSNTFLMFILLDEDKPDF